MKGDCITLLDTRCQEISENDDADWLVKLSRGHWQGGSSTQGIDAGFPLIDYLASLTRNICRCSWVWLIGDFLWESYQKPISIIELPQCNQYRWKEGKPYDWTSEKFVDGKSTQQRHLMTRQICECGLDKEDQNVWWCQTRNLHVCVQYSESWAIFGSCAG